MKKKIFKYIGEALIFLLIGLSLYIIIEVSVANANNRPPRIFGVSISYVPTKSMEPEIMAGDYIIYTSIDYNDVKKDDIIVYYNKDLEKYIVHRVYELYDSYLITKGDNNLAKDSYHVTNNDLYGIYRGKAGFLKIFAGGINKLAIGIILAILIISFIVLQFISFFLKDKKEKLQEENKKIKDELREQMRKELIDEIINSNNISNDDKNMDE